MFPLTVIVTSYDGSPIPGAQVTHLDSLREQQTQATDDRGKSQFDVDSEAPATLTVIAPGYAADRRAIGAPYPTRPDGVEQFLLGPVGLPHYYRGRVRVPFVPVLDAVGIRADGDYGDADTLGETQRFNDPTVVVVRPPELAASGRDTGDRDTLDGVAPSRTDMRWVDEYIRGMHDSADSTASVGEPGALLELTDRGASFLTDTIVVSFISEDADPVEVAARHGLEVVKRFTALPQTYVLRFPGGAVYELLDAVEGIATEPSVRYAEPNLMTTTENDAVTPNDFLFPKQWDFPLEGIPDAWQVLKDLNATNTFGDPAITVAVVDNGLDPVHVSVSGTLSDGTAKLRDAFDFINMVGNVNATNPTGGTNQPDHGMACASAAAGATNNGEGMAGVAGNCHLIAARRSGPETRMAEMYLWLAGLDADSATTGFPAQLADGADVISNSFGFSVDAPISALMQDTFDAVTDDGRAGRGTALFFSAGNDSVDLDTTNRRPWSMYARCYGVTAATLANDGTTQTLATYSNFGTTVDFCALTNDNEGPHNPNQAFGAFTATHRTTPMGTAIPGTGATTTTLSAATAAGATMITVASVTGAVVGGSVLIGAVAAAASRGRTIAAVNAGTRQITLDMALPAAFANGTGVTIGPREYRTDFGGTSYATPVTAGVAALMYSVNPQLGWDQVGEILRRTAMKIDPNNTNATGRWRDVDNRISTDVGYRGPNFSEFYGAGRINAAAAVRRAAWTVDLVTDRMEFIDIPQGETTYRAVRWDVHSLHASTFTTVTAPAAPFSLPVGSTENISGTSDYAVLQDGYIWVAFTGGAPGTSATGSIRVRHSQSSVEWTIPITANSVARKTACVMLVLDRSGSMSANSGVGTNSRMDVLHYSAGILAEAVHEGDGVGIVGFDHDSLPVLVPPVGPLAAPSLFDPTRDQVRSAITTYAVNPAGWTSIGDGLERGQNELTPVSNYDNKATVVFTDGYENSSKFIADISSSITDKTYAVALGRAENIRPAALTAVTKGTGGYCVLTNDLNNDSRYKLAKYFLQVLAGVKNDQIVVDPPVAIPPGATVDVPFVLAETDFVADVLFLTQFPWLVEMTLITPDGDIVDPAFMATLTGRNYFQVGDDIAYYRVTLPAPIGAGAQAGTWLARFHLSEKTIKLAISTHREDGKQLSREEAGVLFSEGLKGTLLVHASSDLKMTVDAEQKSFEPGAKVRLMANLREYDVPVIGRAQVNVLVTDPFGGSFTVPLSEASDGTFSESFVTTKQGVWTCLFQAEGKTWRGTPFTREDVRTVSVWEGGDTEKPEEGREPDVDPKDRPGRPHRAWELVLANPRLVASLREVLEREGLSLGDLDRV